MSFTPASNKVEFKTCDETNNSLNELFNVNSVCRQKPFNERHLPKSFFVQPCVSHHKGFSSPATLEETYRVGLENQQNFHSKQRSLDDQSANQHYSEFHNISTLETKSSSPLINSTNLLEFEVEKLPPGYELAIDNSDRVYFLNHATKGTTWYDPRLPEQIQKWGMTLNELQDLHLRYLRNVSAKTLSSSTPKKLVQNQTFSDSKSQKLYNRLLSSSGINPGVVAADKPCSMINSYQAPPGQPMPHMQYFVNNATSTGQGPIVNSYHELSHLYPNGSSVHGSLSHSSNSSCSNLSTCLNGLNLSPAPPTPIHNQGNSVMMSLCQYGCQVGPGQSNVEHSHSHQDSLDSGVGQSIVSQSHLSTNVPSQQHDSNKLHDLSIKLEDDDNIDCFDNNIDEFMDIDIRCLEF